MNEPSLAQTLAAAREILERMSARAFAPIGNKERQEIILEAARRAKDVPLGPFESTELEMAAEVGRTAAMRAVLEMLKIDADPL